MSPAMKPLKEFSDYGFLRLLVTAPTFQSLITSISTYGFSATIPEARRRRKDIFLRQGRLVPGHKPTPKDYQRIYQQIADEWKDEDLL